MAIRAKVLHDAKRIGIYGFSIYAVFFRSIDERPFYRTSVASRTVSNEQADLWGARLCAVL